MNKIVSIITPSYNSKKFIKDTINSVIAQTYQNWEMIIIDDNSKDGSVNYIKNLIKLENRITLIELNKNVGPAIARNKAIEEATGRYIAFLDSDDLWFPKKLEKQIQFMSDNNIYFSHTYYLTIDESGKKIGRIIEPPLKLSYIDMLKMNRIGCLSVIYDSLKLGKIYMPNIQKRQDYGLWLKILRKIEFTYCLPEVLAQYRIHANSISRNKISLIKYHYSLFREHEKLSYTRTIYFILYNIYITLKKYKKNR